MIVQEKNRLKAPMAKAMSSSYRKIIEFIEMQIKQIDQMIDQCINQIEGFNEIIAVLKTIDGIGDITAISITALMPELGRLNRREVASLAGLAPHPYESGSYKGYRKTRGGREHIKPVLFMAALTASRSMGELGQFYERLLKNSKKKMVALVALMRKIIVIANARVKEQLAQQNLA